MTQPLNYTPKAIEALLAYECPGAPLTRLGNLYIIEKLRQAQVFVLGEHGELLDRSKPRPEIPEMMLKPPFPVVALEYQAGTKDWDAGRFTAAKCSRRIALAWEWTDDFPPALAACGPRVDSAGVAVASIAYFDQMKTWVPIYGAAHIPFDENGRRPTPAFRAVHLASPSAQAMIASGRVSAKLQEQGGIRITPIVLSPETMAVAAMQHGADVVDALSGDLMDELNAYLDLCLALACRNVTTRHHEAPKFLNRQRIKAGKLPLKGFHVLELVGGDMPGFGGGPHGSPRSHLRRGHIRRLPGERVTWVNSTIVRGRGFVDKVYAA